MAPQDKKNTDSVLETISILVHSSTLTNQYKLKRIKEIVGTTKVRVFNKQEKVS